MDCCKKTKECEKGREEKIIDKNNDTALKLNLNYEKKKSIKRRENLNENT